MPVSMTATTTSGAPLKVLCAAGNQRVVLVGRRWLLLLLQTTAGERARLAQRAAQDAGKHRVVRCVGLAVQQRRDVAWPEAHVEVACQKFEGCRGEGGEVDDGRELKGCRGEGWEQNNME
eukprot:352984-Chlamydomonas_euryale.AAC.5